MDGRIIWRNINSIYYVIYYFHLNIFLLYYERVSFVDNL